MYRQSHSSTGHYAFAPPLALALNCKPGRHSAVAFESCRPRIVDACSRAARMQTFTQLPMTKARMLVEITSTLYGMLKSGTGPSINAPEAHVRTEPAWIPHCSRANTGGKARPLCASLGYAAPGDWRSRETGTCTDTWLGDPASSGNPARMDNRRGHSSSKPGAWLAWQSVEPWQTTPETTGELQAGNVCSSMIVALGLLGGQ